MKKLNNIIHNKDVFDFLNSIDTLSLEDIYEKIYNIINNLHQSDFYGFENEFKIAAIKAIDNIDIKTELIKDYFYKHRNIDDCYSFNCIISCVENLNEEDVVKIFNNLFSNFKFEETINCLNIPNNLNFGVELEYSDVSFEDIKKLFETNTIIPLMKSLDIPECLINQIINNIDFEKKNQFNNWNFSMEGRNLSLPEASSPIMNNTLVDLNEINFICTLFKVLGAKTNGGTGLHINVDTNYFNSNINALKYLLLIWGECEEIFYKIANQENEEMRNCSNNMAVPIKMNIQKTFDGGNNITLHNKKNFDKFIYNIQVSERFEKILMFRFSNLSFELSFAKTEEERYKIFRKYLEEMRNKEACIRYTSLNFTHMTWYKQDKGRIEFRLFNSNLDFEIIMQNLLLIGKLMETCLELANNSLSKKEKFTELLNRDISEEDKLNLLLDLLFDSEQEKEIFRRRWNSIKDKDSYSKFKSGYETFIPYKNKVYKK